MKPIDKAVTDWFLKEFWPAYPGKFCGRGKGSRGIALRHMLKVNPDADEMVRILGNLKAQVRAHAQKPPEQRNYWKIGETYVYNRLWNDEIESAMEIKETQKLSTCRIDGCTDPVHGPAFNVCAFHVRNNHDERLREAWIRTGINKRDPDYLEQCRVYCKERMNLLCR